MTNTRRQSALAPISNSTMNSRASLSGASRVSLLPKDINVANNNNNSMNNSGMSTNKSSRMSLAPTRGRPSLAPSRPSTIGTSSLAMSQPPPSTTPMLLNTTTAANSRVSLSNRRMTAIASAPRATSFYGTTDTNKKQIKDTRQITNPIWIDMKVQELIAFMVEHGYDQVIDPKMVKSPTKLQFQSYFIFLYLLIDKHMEFDMKSFEDQVIKLSKFLHYPFEIKKAAVYAPGGGGNWAGLFALLIWMMEICKYNYCLLIKENNYNHPTEDDDLHTAPYDPEQQCYNFLTKSYAAFLAGDDEDDVAEFFGPSFQQRESQLKSDISSLTRSNNKLMESITHDESSPSPLTEALLYKDQLFKDNKKFTDFIQELHDHKIKVTNLKKEREDKIVEIDQSIKSLEVEKQELLEKIKKQEMNAEDVLKINQEKNSIENNIYNIKEKKDTLSQQIYDLERKIHAKKEDIEAVVFTYTKTVEKLGLHINSYGIDLSINLLLYNNNGGDVINKDIHRQIKPNIAQLLSIFMTTANQKSAELSSINNDIDKFDEISSEKKYEVIENENQIKKLNTHYEIDKELLNTEIKKIENENQLLSDELEDIKNNNKTLITNINNYIEKLKIDYDELKKSNEMDKKEYTQTLLVTLDILTNYKSYMSENISLLYSVVNQSIHEVQAIDVSSFE